MNAVLFESCHATLLGLLGQLSKSVGDEHKGKVMEIFELTNELRLLAREWLAEGLKPLEIRRDEQTDSDPTNYRMYELLRACGLTLNQLVLVAKSEGLHHLRMLRMIRTVSNVSLEQAEAAIAASNSCELSND